MAHQKTKVVSLILALVMLMATVFAFPFSISADDTDSTSSTSYIHNFTEQGKDSSFYTISGNLSTSKGTVTYNDLTLTQCLKMESSTSISFTAPAAGTLTLVFVEATPNIKVDGKKIVGANGTITVDVASGSHTITKADTMNLFYMVYAPAGEVCTHTYEAAVTAPTCTEDGYTTYTCTVCGHSYKENGAAKNGHTPGAAATCTSAQTCTVCGDELASVLEHNYVNGSCSACGKVDQKNCTHSNVTSAETAPTCTAAGYTTYTCTACGYAYTADNTAALGHNYVDGICSRCGASTTHNFTPSADVTSAGTDGGAIAAGTTYDDGYFTVVDTVTQRVKNGAVYCVEVAKNGTGAIRFTVKNTAKVVVAFSSTGGDNTSAIGIANEYGAIMENVTGVYTVTGTTAKEFTYYLPAGTYYVVSPQSDYKRGARVFSVNVEEDAELLAIDESGNKTYIENTYFEFLGASIRYADANGVTKSTNLVDIRFSYKFKEGVEITKWGWEYKLGNKDTASKEGVSMTDDNVTNLVFTKVAFINFEYKIQARIWFEVEIDGETYTVYGNYNSRTTYDVLENYANLEDGINDDARSYAQSVLDNYSEYLVPVETVALITEGKEDQ